MVNVRQIAEMGSYVNLLEYNKIEVNLRDFFFFNFKKGSFSSKFEQQFFFEFFFHNRI